MKNEPNDSDFCKCLSRNHFIKQVIYFFFEVLKIFIQTDKLIWKPIKVVLLDSDVKAMHSVTKCKQPDFIEHVLYCQSILPD